MSKIKLPPADKLRRQLKPNGGYEMVPAYTTDEVIAILEAHSLGHDMKRREAFHAGVASIKPRVLQLELALQVATCAVRDLTNGWPVGELGTSPETIMATLDELVPGHEVQPL